MALVATKNGVGIPVFQRAVKAKADQPRKHYRFSLNRAERRLVRKADGLGVAATQRVGLQDGLYRRAWVARDGKFPKVGQSGATLAASRCNPVQSGGTYNGCYYGYTDLSSMNLSSAFSTQISEAPMAKKARMSAFSMATTARSSSSADRAARVSDTVIA